MVGRVDVTPASHSTCPKLISPNRSTVAIIGQWTIESIKHAYVLLDLARRFYLGGSCRVEDPPDYFVIIIWSGLG